MKIGIITLWGSNNNYGQVLQAYALQKVLRNYGYDAKHINYIPTQNFSLKKEILTLLGNPKWFIKKIFLNLFVYIPEKKKGNDFEATHPRHFDEFRDKNIIQFENRYTSIDELRRDPPNVDTLITGSDQVWGVGVNDNALAYYLDFSDLITKRIAYAASFGSKSKSTVYIKTAKQYIKRFDSVMVREQSGVDICKSMGYSNAKYVLDPTLLLSANDYQLLFSKTNIDRWVQPRKLFGYFLNFSKAGDITWDVISTFIKEERYNERIVVSSGGLKTAFDRLSYASYYFPDPINWIYSISVADAIVTNSFHGIVFSILFHRNFLFIPLQGQGANLNERISCLLSEVGLKDRVYRSSLTLKYQISKAINWQSVDEIVNSRKDYSKKALVDALLS